MSEFLVQLFYVRWAGALVHALLAVLLQLSVWKAARYVCKEENRGLYALDNGNDGKIWKQEEKTGKQIVRYRIKNEGHYYVLDYHIDPDGTVAAVDWWYKP